MMGWGECLPIRRVQALNWWDVHASEANAAQYWVLFWFPIHKTSKQRILAVEIPIPNSTLQCHHPNGTLGFFKVKLFYVWPTISLRVNYFKYKSSILYSWFHDKCTNIIFMSLASMIILLFVAKIIENVTVKKFKHSYIFRWGSTIQWHVCLYVLKG